MITGKRLACLRLYKPNTKPFCQASLQVPKPVRPMFRLMLSYVAQSKCMAIAPRASPCNV